MPSESRHPAKPLPSRNSLLSDPFRMMMTAVVCSLLLTACPASTPTAPSTSGSSSSGGSSSAGGQSGGSSSGPGGMPGSAGGMPGSAGGMPGSSAGMPGSDDGMSGSNSTGGSQGSGGNAEDVWQPPAAGGMPGPQGGGGPTADAGGGYQDGGNDGSDSGAADASGEGTAGDNTSDGDLSLEVSLEVFDDSMPDLSDIMDSGQAPGSGASGTSGASGSPDGPGAPPANASGGAATTAEQVAILDARLETSTGKFDDLILREREVIRHTAKSSELPQPSSEPAYGTAPGQEEYGVMPPSPGGGAYGTGDSGNSDPSDGSVVGASSGGNRGGGTAFPTQARVYPPPDDIPDGNDDDVVARQLREAAMREADPQLREKLWDEYRTYKGLKK